MITKNNTKNRIYKFTIAIIITITAALFVLIQADTIYAEDEEGFETTNLKIETVVNEDHSYDVSEEVTVNFLDDMMSYQISIPAGKYQISNLRVSGSSFNTDTDTENSAELINITSQNDLTKGEHTFVIKYDIEEYAEDNKDYDMFYYVAIPNTWDTPINNVDITLVLPENFVWDDLQYYAGQFESQDVNKKISYTVDGNTINVKASKIPANFGLTFKAQLPDGYWKDPLSNNWTMNFALILSAAIMLLILLMWFIGGRDPVYKKAIRHYPIDEISPAEVGYLLDGKMKIRDINALIIYLASKGYLRINKYEPKKYELVKMKEPKEEKRFIRNLYNIIFENIYTERSVKIDEIGPRINKAFEETALSVASGFQSKNLKTCTLKSKVFRWISSALVSLGVAGIIILTYIHDYQDVVYGVPLIMGIGTFVTLALICWRFDIKYSMNLAKHRTLFSIYIASYLAIITYTGFIVMESFGSLWIAAGVAVSAVISMVLICIMKARAPENAKIINELIGLRVFIDKSDNKELSKMQAENYGYYYEIYPYAYIFSLSNKWARKFRWKNVELPEWYTNNVSGYETVSAMKEISTIDLSRSLNEFGRTVENAYYDSGGRRSFV